MRRSSFGANIFKKLAIKYDYKARAMTLDRVEIPESNQFKAKFDDISKQIQAFPQLFPIRFGSSKNENIYSALEILFGIETASCAQHILSSESASISSHDHMTDEMLNKTLPYFHIDHLKSVLARYAVVNTGGIHQNTYLLAAKISCAHYPKESIHILNKASNCASDFNIKLAVAIYQAPMQIWQVMEEMNNSQILPDAASYQLASLACTALQDFTNAGLNLSEAQVHFGKQHDFQNHASVFSGLVSTLQFSEARSLLENMQILEETPDILSAFAHMLADHARSETQFRKPNSTMKFAEYILNVGLSQTAIQSTCSLAMSIMMSEKDYESSAAVYITCKKLSINLQDDIVEALLRAAPFDL